MDHVVSLQDAYDSGASSWSNAKKEVFANDRLNHVPACASVNRSKGASRPKDVIRKAGDGKGVDFSFYDRCSYIKKYYKVKKKYRLSLEENSKKLFGECGLLGDSDPEPPRQWRTGARNTASDKYSAISTAFHGNVKSHVFHSSSCRYFNCKNCTATFSSRMAALQAGYRACGQCSP